MTYSVKEMFLTLQGEQYSVEVHGRLTEVVAILRTADRHARAGVV